MNHKLINIIIIYLINRQMICITKEIISKYRIEDKEKGKIKEILK